MEKDFVENENTKNIRLIPVYSETSSEIMYIAKFQVRCESVEFNVTTWADHEMTIRIYKEEI